MLPPACRHAVAAVLEGCDAVFILHSDPAAGSLTSQQLLQLDGMCSPSEAHFDGHGRLWVIGGPVGQAATGVLLGIAECPTGSKVGTQGVMYLRMPLQAHIAAQMASV